MSQVVAISEAAAIAIHAILLLAMKSEQQQTAASIAAALQVSENHCVKVMQRLVHAGLVSAVRGPKGGFHLAVDPKELPLLRIYEVIDGPLVEKHCLFKVSKCPAAKCVFGSLTGQINGMVRDFLRNNTVADVMEKF